MVELFSIFVKHSLDAADIRKIDQLQLEHARLFATGPEYADMFRPKHHFLAHAALDAWRFGPLRGYWCFGFESFNKVMKAGAERSNWKNETLSIMEYWAMRSGHEYVQSDRKHVTQYL